jgi:hypothetical protein
MGIYINGKSYDNVKGKNIVINNDQVIVDGKVVESGLSGIVKIEFTGDLANLDCSSCIINGNILGDVDATNVKCGDVVGDIDGTNISCGNVGGDIDGTNITCGDVKGNIVAKKVSCKSNSGNITL